MKILLAAVAAVLASDAFAADVDVRAFGAKGDGVTKDTAAIQKAVDACAKDGGGDVRFGGGRFLTGMFFLKSGVTLRLDANATILGSPDCDDYPTNAVVRHLDASKTPRLRTTALIVADECRNVGIVGTGMIDCNGMAFVRLSNRREYGYVNDGNNKDAKPLGEDEWTNWKYRRIPGKLSPPRMVLFAGCEDVKVTDVKLVHQAAGWGFWVNDCDRVAFDRVKVLSDPDLPNNDGIHVNASRDVSVANCRVIAGDDAIVVRCNNRMLKERKVCERVTVVNCQLTSHANCVRIGWLNDGTVRNCVFSNLAMTDSACGIGIDIPSLEPGMNDYGDEASAYEDILFSNIVMDRIYSSPVRVEVTSDKFARVKTIRRITFSNMRCRAYRFPDILCAKGREIEDFSFAGCSFVRVPDGAFPGKWRQKGAAYWWNSHAERFTGVKGVRFDDCTFTEE